MAEERLRLVVQEPERYNEHLPGNQGFTRQHVELRARTVELGESGSVVVAEADAYLDHPDTPFLTAYWFSRKPPTEFIKLAEGAVTQLERRFSHGAPTVDKRNRLVSTPKAVEMLWGIAAAAHLDVAIRPRNEYRSGVILFTSGEAAGSGRRLTLPLQRPLSWERLDRLSHQKPISFARLNTLVGDFCITREGEGNSFGFLTDLTKTEPFAALLEATAVEEVPHEKAIEFLAAVTGLFAAGKGGL